MKFLKYLLVLVFVLVILFLGMGLATPSIGYENEVSVNKPIEEAWAVMTDESKISDWLNVITKVEHVSGEPNTVGAVTHFYVVENGKEMMMKETITAIKVNEYMAMTFTMDFMNMDYIMNFEEKDGVTNISSKSTTTGNGIVAKSIISLMPSVMQSQEQENLSRLKKIIEENTTNYFPVSDIGSTNN